MRAGRGGGLVTFWRASASSALRRTLSVLPMNSTMQTGSTHVPDIIGSLSEFDILAFQRYSDQGHGTSDLQPERSLMLAVLLDAVESFQKYALLQDKYSNRLFRETETWILEEDQEWPFSFINICDALEIDSRYLQKGLFQWKQNAIQSSKERNKRCA